MCFPRIIFQASKATIAQFFETLRIEFGPDIGITLVTPGFIESELTQGKHMSKAGELEVDQDIRDVSCFPFLFSTCAQYKHQNSLISTTKQSKAKHDSYS